MSGGTLTTSANETVSNLTEFCRVIGVSKPTGDSHITFEVWVPVKGWNGKFLSAGEGGFAGVLAYTRGGLDGALDEFLRRGYATASTDTGHVSSTRWRLRGSQTGMTTTARRRVSARSAMCRPSCC